MKTDVGGDAQKKVASHHRLTGEFTPADFAEVIQHLPEHCPLVGGQAVAWWASKYDVRIDPKGPNVAITSSDIDFWGTGDDLISLARGLGRKPIFPHQYEMTVWAGAVQLYIKEKESLAEFLHTIPGLDTHDPERSCFGQSYASGSVVKAIQVLTPISLVYAKLHCLRNFSQDGRDDDMHLRVCLAAARCFLNQIISEGKIRMALWNIERLIAAHQFKPYNRLEVQFKFNILDGIPNDDILKHSTDPALDEADRNRLAQFLNVRWKSIQ
jgi:hypothetical protein